MNVKCGCCHRHKKAVVSLVRVLPRPLLCNKLAKKMLELLAVSLFLSKFATKFCPSPVCFGGDMTLLNAYKADESIKIWRNICGFRKKYS